MEGGGGGGAREAINPPRHEGLNFGILKLRDQSRGLVFAFLI